MGIGTFVAGLVALGAPSPTYTLAYSDGSFTVHNAQISETIPLVSPRSVPRTAVMFRNDKSFAVWDKRGITIRVGSKVWSTHLTDIAVTPKLFTRDQILQTVSLLKAGARHKEASSLAGALRVGLNTFFLVQWNDTSGEPWLEALVEVNLGDRSPEPKLLGRFDGLSTARGFISDDLFLFKGRITAATRRQHDWGLANYTPGSDQFEFVSMGDQLLSWLPPRFYTEQRVYGTIVGGVIDERMMQATPLFEDRGVAEWVDRFSPPLAVIKQRTGFVLRNGTSGTETAIPADLGVARSKFGLLVWTPKEHPADATLYNPDRWDVLAKWPVTGATLPDRAEPAPPTR